MTRRLQKFSLRAALIGAVGCLVALGAAPAGAVPAAGKVYAPAAADHIEAVARKGRIVRRAPVRRVYGRRGFPVGAAIGILAAGAAAAAASGAFAEDDGYYYVPRRRYYRPAPVYDAPVYGAPIYDAPVYAAPPVYGAPVYGGYVGRPARSYRHGYGGGRGGWAGRPQNVAPPVARAPRGGGGGWAGARTAAPQPFQPGFGQQVPSMRLDH